MDRRKRNLICIWLMALGFINLTAYTALYAFIEGDAINGNVHRETVDGQTVTRYFLRGHFLHGTDGQGRECSRIVWIYSYIHSLAIIPTCVAVIVPLMILARPHIIATMQEGSWVKGSTFMTVSMTILILLAILWTLWQSLSFVQELWG